MNKTRIFTNFNTIGYRAPHRQPIAVVKKTNEAKHATKAPDTKYYGALKVQDAKKATPTEPPKAITTVITKRQETLKTKPIKGKQAVQPPVPSHNLITPEMELHEPLEIKQVPQKRKHTNTGIPSVSAKKKKEGVTVGKKNQEVVLPQYDLSPLLKKCLDVEIDILLKKITEAIPEIKEDMPETDKTVIDILQNEASYDLADVFALNVKKRILNVHNTLYAKLSFCMTPSVEIIKALRKNYNLAAISKLSPKVYAVELATLSDFDEFCAMKKIKFSGIVIKIFPVYGFTICPPELQNTPSRKKLANQKDEKNKTEPNADNLSNKNKIKAITNNKISECITPNAKAKPVASLPTTNSTNNKDNEPKSKADIKKPSQTVTNINVNKEKQINANNKKPNQVINKPDIALVQAATQNVQENKKQTVTKSDAVKSTKVNKEKIANDNKSNDKKEIEKDFVKEPEVFVDFTSMLDDAIVLDEC